MTLNTEECNSLDMTEVITCKNILIKFLKEHNLIFDENRNLLGNQHTINVANRTIYGPTPLTIKELMIFLMACTVLIEPLIKLTKSKQIVRAYLEMENVDPNVISDSFDFYDRILEKAI